MSRARLALALLLVAACDGRVDLGGTSQCECAPAATAGTGPDAAREQDASAGVDSGGEAASAADATAGGSDARVADTGSEASASVDAPTYTGPPVYPTWCSDGVRDGDETDVDCGGHCAPCGPRMGCLVDADCSKTAAGCDLTSGGCYCDAVAFICVHSHCFDHVEDGDESAGDCGGATCVLCAVGQTCNSDADCTSAACDALSLRCVESQCDDHHQDGAESDVDCGGSPCASCAVGQHCFSSLDCPAGHFCNQSKVCQ
jgi:hypothetical protein